MPWRVASMFLGYVRAAFLHDFPILSVIGLSLDIQRPFLNHSFFLETLRRGIRDDWLFFAATSRFLWLSCLLFHVFAEPCQISPVTPLNESCVVSKGLEGDPFRPEEGVFEARWG